MAMKALVDTSLLVDILRGHQPAVSWLSQQDELGACTIVWLEILQGAQNKTKQQQAIRLLNQFHRVDPTPEDFDWAYTQILQYNLSHNIGVWDAMIASVNHRLQLPLYTGNLKHFTPLLGTLAQRPY